MLQNVKMFLLVSPCWKSDYFDSITAVWYRPDSLIVYKMPFANSYWQIWDKLETWMLGLWTNKTWTSLSFHGDWKQDFSALCENTILWFSTMDTERELCFFFFFYL